MSATEGDFEKVLFAGGLGGNASGKSFAGEQGRFRMFDSDFVLLLSLREPPLSRCCGSDGRTRTRLALLELPLLSPEAV